MISAIIISIFIGSTEDGYNVNSFDIAMAKTASTSHVKHMTKHKNIILILLFITFEEMSAIDFPFSFILIINAPKSCTAPMKIVPSTTQSIAGIHPQYTAMHGPMIGAAPAMEVKWWPNRIWHFVGLKSMLSFNSWEGILMSCCKS